MTAVRNLTKSVLHWFGFRISRTSVPFRTVTDTLHALPSRGFSPRTVIDVGVADGTPEIYSAFPDARLILIEPLPIYRPALEALLAHRPGKLYPFAAGDYDGHADIRVPVDPRKATITSTSELNEVASTATRIQVTRLDSLHLSSNPGPLFLKIDVEGAEAAVLRGADELLRVVDAVLIEMTLSSSSRPTDASTLSEALAILEPRGFALVDILAAADRVRGGPLLHTDLLFMRLTEATRSYLLGPDREST